MRIDHDIHIHTPLSLCCKDPNATVDSYIRQARTKGIRKLGFSNHFWDSEIPGANGFYIPQDFDHVASVRADICRAAAENPDMKLMFGCEVEFDIARRDIAVTEEHAAQFDYMLVPNSHTHMIMPKELIGQKKEHAQFMMDVFMDTVRSPLAKYITGIAHPFNAVACPYDNRELYGLIEKAQYREAFCAAKEANIAIEVNIACFKGMTLGEIVEHPAIEMFALAKECGCRFTFGSDSHAVGEGSPQDYWAQTYVVAALAGLTNEDVAEIVR